MPTSNRIIAHESVQIRSSSEDETAGFRCDRHGTGRLENPGIRIICETTPWIQYRGAVKKTDYFPTTSQIESGKGWDTTTYAEDPTVPRHDDLFSSLVRVMINLVTSPPSCKGRQLDTFSMYINSNHSGTVNEYGLM